MLLLDEPTNGLDDSVVSEPFLYLFIYVSTPKTVSCNDA